MNTRHEGSAGERNENNKNAVKRYVYLLTGCCVLVMTLIVVLLVMFGKKEKKEIFLQPEGDRISSREVQVSLTPFGVQPDFPEEEITILKLKEIVSQIAGEEVANEILKKYKSTYSDTAYMLRTDYLAVYADMLSKMESDLGATMNSFTVLATSTNIDQEKSGLTLSDNSFYTNEGFLEVGMDARDGKEILYHKITGYVCQGEMYWITQIGEVEYTFYNVFLLEPSEGLFYSDGIYFVYDPALFSDFGREQVLDITIGEGSVSEIISYSDKVSGKLLSASEEGIEVEGLKKLSLDDHFKVYDLCNDLGGANLGVLPIGYDFCDFVIQGDIVKAAFIVRTGEMDRIRVLLRGPNLEGRYYEALTFVSDAQLNVSMDGEESVILPSEKLELTASEYPVGLRIQINSTVLTQKTRILEVLRSQGNANYRGDFEVLVTSDGFVVINELALEEYLYAVVPSEMPSSYPKEALKAQAICARTYAYMNMVKAGYPKYGAHVDDSAGYQVYQNISENVNTSQAVKETSKQMLYYNGQLAQTYYYSTSAGFGNSVEVWNGRRESEFPYMTSIHYGTQESSYTPEMLQDNAVYDEYIRKVDSSDFEANEGWYRWTYSPKEISSDVILEKLKARYGMNSSLVLTKTKDGVYESKEVKTLGDILDIEITKRLPGGNVLEMIITGSENTYKVLTELYIRAILCDGETKVVRQSGDEVSMPSLLPSGFISLEIEKIDSIVVQYKIYGGGFGHGVGMSQNGAKAMANMGYSTAQILGYYYQGCEVH